MYAKQRVLLLRGEEAVVDKFCGGTLEAGLLEMDPGLNMFDLNDPYVVDVDSEDEDVEVSDHRSGRRRRLRRVEKEAERVPHPYFLKVDHRNLQPSDVVGKIEFADLVEATRKKTLEGVREEQYYSSENRKRSPKLESRINCGAHMRILRNGSKWIVSHFNTVHNHPMVNSNQTGLIRSHRYVDEAHLKEAIAMRDSGGGRKYTLRRYTRPDRVIEVIYYEDRALMQCSCQKLETEGIPCRHQVCVMKMENLVSVPRGMVYRRWTKDAGNISSYKPRYRVDEKERKLFRHVSLRVLWNCLCELDTGRDRARRAPRPTLGRCGHCGRTGHTIRKCLYINMDRVVVRNRGAEEENTDYDESDEEAIFCQEFPYLQEAWDEDDARAGRLGQRDIALNTWNGFDLNM
ncbi:hypothetical protein COLO4_16888 [Corchorus olitorius]|uniref:Uncharacterized protein n=1 Tax=Corchorus olitorius TaxID=93759 RepID=A0A1R3JF73_9ROSI|nr:hypothetical protein COLO4_16888 [Corchorus olitorius]